MTSSYSYTSTTCSTVSTSNGTTTALECYNIVNTKQLVTSIWLSAAGGVAVMVLFAVLRNNKCWRDIYHKRATQITDLIRRPWPFLNGNLMDRCWSFLYVIFATPDSSIFLSAGIDSLMIVRTNLLGVQLFTPLTAMCLSVLLPLYRTGGYLESTESTANTDSIMLYTLANLASKDNKLWAAIVLSPCIILWGLRCVYYHFCSFAAFRLLQGWLVDTGVDSEEGRCDRMLLGARPTASWRGFLRGLWAYVSPQYMHLLDLETIKLVKADVRKRERKSAATPLYFDAEEVRNPFHPYWELPEEQPRSVNGIRKPYGLILGKSSWQYRKRMLVSCRGETRCVAVRNFVVLYRDAGAVHLNSRLGGILGVSEVDETIWDECEKAKRRTLYGSRLSTLEAELRGVFGDELLDVVPVYEPRTVNKLLFKLDEVYGAIHKLESELQKSGSSRHADLEAAAPSVPASIFWRNKKQNKMENKKKKLEEKRKVLAGLEAAIAAERAQALESPVDVAAFAIFSNHRAARLAAGGDIGLVPSIDMVSSQAPCPDSINFHALPSTQADHRKALVWTIPFFVLLMLFPIGALTGALANLTLAVCGGTPETNNLYWAGYCDAGKTVSFILTTIVPVSISAFWDTFLMPLCCQQLTQRLRIAVSLPQMDRDITVQLYVFTVFNTFFLGVLGGAAITGIGAAIQNGQVADLIGQSLPTASNYFLNYAAVHALFTNLFRYFWPHDGTVLFQGLRLIRLAAQPFSERERWIIRSTPSFRSARHYASFLLIFIIGTSYAVISPFILPLSLAFVLECAGTLEQAPNLTRSLNPRRFFVTSWMAWKYNATHFYQPNYESRGDVWLVVYRCYVCTLGVSIFFTVCVIVSKRFYWQAVVMAALDVFVIHMGLMYIRRNVSKYVNAFPLQRILPVNILGPATAREIRLMYTPPSLRPGSVGWFPEGGKLWEKYGLPF